jgi:hypothetical protein
MIDCENDEMFKSLPVRGRNKISKSKSISCLFSSSR